MPKLTNLMMLAFVPILVAGCQTTASVNSGDGFKALTPSAATRKFIIKYDIPFARQVAAHNRFCKTQKGCVS